MLPSLSYQPTRRLQKSSSTFLTEIKSRVARLFFVLNKIDYLTDAEREMALGFYRTVLTRDAGIDPNTRIFADICTEGIAGKRVR